MPKILYLSHAPPEVYAIVRAEMPPGFTLVTLDQDSEAERVQKIADCEVVIVASMPLRRAVLDAGKRLRLVHHQGVGYHDTVDVEAVRERGLPLALTPEGTTIGVAEHAILLMLAVYKRLSFADAELRAGRWHVNALRPESRELYGRTVGFVGMGRIGQATRERLRAFDTVGIYADEVSLSAERERALDIRRVTLDELLATADIVSLHVPLTSATKHMIDARALARMKPGSVLINTARGGLVRETDLIQALQSGQLSGAGLDVFETEPVAPDNPLTRMRNVVLTPHISAGTRDALSAKMRAVAANIERFYRGEKLLNRVTLD